LVDIRDFQISVVLRGLARHKYHVSQVNSVYYQPIRGFSTRQDGSTTTSKPCTPSPQIYTF
ncbi:MAG: hypothetical protein Q4E90_05700, partial [Collinsella sp.]|nr:hypothetical protein [Collinsella sp.]